ncbi:MAG: S8 family serine peptidase [Gammaproteobacteria bacterium]|nr:S8 family serine peptidase [Gammaproteobacteria bacterium]
MDDRLKVLNGLAGILLLVLMLIQLPVFAKSATTPTDRLERQRYIVLFDDPPLAAYDGRVLQTPEMEEATSRFQPTAISFTGASKLDVNSVESREYRQFLDQRFEAFKGEALLRLGRQLQASHRYRNALNGFATDLTAAEARALREMPGVSSVRQDEIQKLETDSGPNWLGADKIQDGTAGFPATSGEGVIVGIIDSGVNWDHPSFEDPGESGFGWDHTNPYGDQLGLCILPEVLCNDKLVGIFDFVEDDANTDVIEESNNGKDNTGHGSHVASTAAGNPANVTINGIPTEIGGVAPNANIVSYRVCFIGDPVDDDDDGCQTSAIFSAIDQAIEDAVDVVNYSIGSTAHDPWITSTTTYAFLNLREAGIFAATSAGNAGPNAGTMGSPANAPWITAVGNATHDRVFASALENLTGGDTTPPNDLVGASFTDGIGIRQIVHAKDFGNALCGTGDAESQPDCASNTGLSNPFAPGTFNGQIVVCDRGTYGRIEKGKNLQLAGAGGYILANTTDWGEGTEADSHCLPATHLGLNDSNKLRSWLDSGSNHRGSISGFSIFQIQEAGDVLARSSSRGPNPSPAEDVMKPDVIAPGTQILAASSVDNNFAFLTGTSMASPHVTGGAALLKAVHPNWTPPMLASALVMTATPELAIDSDGSEATILKRGAGRPRLDEAVNAGLYLNETRSGFVNANPRNGGDPKNLNLPGLTDTVCRNTCTFSRRVTDLAGGASWSATAEGLPSGASVSISPSNFSVANGGSQLLTITVDLVQSDKVGEWVYGAVRLTSSGLADAVLPLAVFYDGGALPDEWSISTDSVAGSQVFTIDGLAAMPDATFTSGGLVEPTLTVENLPQDPDADSPYDSSVGVMTVWHTVPEGTLWLHTETLESTAVDLDLFVGLDSNGNGRADEEEELCSSTSPTEIELCDLFSPVAGEYWVLVQNWDASLNPDEATLKSAVVSRNPASPLTVTGDGIVTVGASQDIRVQWDNVGAVPGTELIGAVGLGTRRENPNDIGIIPVSFTKTAVAAPKTLVLMDGVERGVTLGGNSTHDRIFVDIPPGVDSFTISSTASGNDSQQNEALGMELYRVDFDNAFTAAPFAAAADTSGAPLASATGSGATGPTVTVGGGDVVAGRWYVVLNNSSNANADIDIRADMSFSGSLVPLRPGLWQASSREGLNQGFDYTSTGGFRAFLWYTYDEAGRPAWYLASGPEPSGNVWVAELLRFTNDGTLQQEIPVGHVSISLLAEEDSIFSFVLFGEDGSDRERPSLPPICPEVDGSKLSYNGLWSRSPVGVGGATVVVNATSQAFVHYIYDASGRPVWLIGAPEPQSAEAREADLLQFGGYCAVCAESELTIDTVGTFTRDFSSESAMTWNLNFDLIAPLSGTRDSTDDTAKLTMPMVCQ